MQQKFHQTQTTMCLLTFGFLLFCSKALANAAPIDDPPTTNDPVTSPAEHASDTEAASTDKSTAETDEAFLAGPAPSPLENEESGSIKEDVTSEKSRKRDHHFQGFVNVLFGTGWYLVAPYDKDDADKACSELTPSTDEENKMVGDAVCSGRSALHLDFLGGFGLLPGLELFAMFRLGVERPNERAPKPRQIGAGIKVYSPKDGLFKIGFGVAPLFDFSDRKADLGYDFMIHVPVLAQFDINRWFGAYAQVAPNISFLTEFRLDITAGIGVQGRFI